MENFNLEKDMQPLFEQAEKEGKWLYCSYQGLWFSPRELKEKQANGQCRWGSVNWHVRDPYEHLEELRRQRDALEKGIGAFLLRLAKEAE